MSKPIEVDVSTLLGGRVVFACSCCEAYVSRGSDALCRDMYDHSHASAEFAGYAFFSGTYVKMVVPWRCDGCGCMMAGGSMAWPGALIPATG